MNTKKEIEPLRQAQGDRKVEVSKSPEQNLETLSWVEKIERKFARVPNQTVTPLDDTVVVQPFGDAQGKQPPVTLPINQQQMQVGKKAPVTEGIAWLVAWVIRQIKIFAKSGRRIRLQDMPEVKESIKPLNH